MEPISKPVEGQKHETPHSDTHEVVHDKASTHDEVAHPTHDQEHLKDIEYKHSDSHAYEVEHGSNDGALWKGAKPHEDGDEAEGFAPLIEQHNLGRDSSREESELDLPLEDVEEANVEEVMYVEESEVEDDIEERLQLYSEVLGLRKELEVVKEDESRLKQQLAETQQLILEYDPQVEKLITVLEDEARLSSLKKIWEEQCRALNPEDADWSTINIANLSERVQEVRKRSMLTSEKVDMLYADRDAKINHHTDSREQSKAKLKERFEEDMENFKELRTRLKQINDEHLFHKHRGTARVVNRNVVSDETKKIARQNRVGEVENRTSAQVGALKSSLTDLMEECKLLKKQLNESQLLSEKRKNALEESLHKIQEEGSEAREMRQVLEEEKEKLSAVKVDLQGVLHYVRAAKREEEIF